MTTGERTQCRRASGPGCSEDGGIDIWPEMARSRWRQAWSTRSAHSSHCIALRCARRTRVNAFKKKILPWRGIEPRFRRRQRRVLATIRPQRRLTSTDEFQLHIHDTGTNHSKQPQSDAKQHPQRSRSQRHPLSPTRAQRPAGPPPRPAPASPRTKVHPSAATEP